MPSQGVIPRSCLVPPGRKHPDNASHLMSAGNAVSRPGPLRHLTWYPTGVVEATARWPGELHAADESPDLANQVAGRPPGSPTSDASPGQFHEPDPASVCLRGETP